MEAAFGHDFSQVRVHEGGHAESLGAIAYTRGRDIHFAPGRYSPMSRGGQELLGHELAHVVQQSHGRVTMPQGSGAPINADPGLEAEADRLGRAAARGHSPSGFTVQPAKAEGGSESGPVQPKAASRAIQCNGGPSEDDSRRQLSLFNKLGVGTGLFYSGFVGRNIYQQSQTGSPNPSPRIRALRATAGFGPGTVGHGAHFGISGIHSLLGNIGQSNIGTLFSSQQAQRLLGKPIGSLANLKLGMLEHGFWKNRFAGIGANGPSTLGERFGGLLGSSVAPSTRAGIQSVGNMLRTVAPRVALRIPQVAGIAGGLALARQSLTKKKQEHK